MTKQCDTSDINMPAIICDFHRFLLILGGSLTGCKFSDKVMNQFKMFQYILKERW